MGRMKELKTIALRYSVLRNEVMQQIHDMVCVRLSLLRTTLHTMETNLVHNNSGVAKGTREKQFHVYQ